jgi:putative transposase
MSQFTYKEAYGRNLPHLQPPEANLFVTFRLADSIPCPVMDEWLREKRQLAAVQLRRAALGQPEDAGEQLAFQRRWFRKFELLLDAGKTGPLWLGEPRVAELVREALHYRDGKVYSLDAFCIMPNHVHTVFAPLLSEAKARELAMRAWRQKRARFRAGQSGDLGSDQRTAADGSRRTNTLSLGCPGQPEPDPNSATQPDRLRYTAVLSVIMQSLKGYTARKCNIELGRRGSFWQHESFDHVIDDEGEFDRTIRYVLNNPVKAGLAKDWREWPWSYCRPQVMPPT